MQGGACLFVATSGYGPAVTKPFKKPEWKPTGGTGMAEGVGLQVQVREMWIEPPAPPRDPTPPPHRATRTAAECAELARRQQAGEELGLSDAFVAEWSA